MRPEKRVKNLNSGIQSLPILPSVSIWIHIQILKHDLINMHYNIVYGS